MLNSVPKRQKGAMPWTAGCGQDCIVKYAGLARPFVTDGGQAPASIWNRRGADGLGVCGPDGLAYQRYVSKIENWSCRLVDAAALVVAVAIAIGADVEQTSQNG